MEMDWSSKRNDQVEMRHRGTSKSWLVQVPPEWAYFSNPNACVLMCIKKPEFIPMVLVGTKRSTDWFHKGKARKVQRSVRSFIVVSQIPMQ